MAGIKFYQVGTADVAKNKVMSLAQEILLLSESIDHHEVEEDAEKGQGHVGGDHDYSIHHSR